MGNIQISNLLTRNNNSGSVAQSNPIHLTQSFNTNLTQVMIMPNINIKRNAAAADAAATSTLAD